MSEQSDGPSAVSHRDPGRRPLLTGLLGLSASLLAVRPALAQGTAGHHHGTGSVQPTPPATPAPRGVPLVDPETRRSANGELRTTLRIHYTYKDVGGFRLYMRSYDGMIPGPTLRVRPGDTLRIRLVNDLPPNRDTTPMDLSIPHHFNTTNFHFHGSHVSPEGIADNVLRVMEPGQTYDVEIPIPADHTRGTYWYHPHHHGGADVQMASGMVGAIIVEGDFAEVPEIANAVERTLVLGQVVFDRHGMIERFETVFPEGATRFLTVNGQREPVIQMRPGEVQRWRLLHAGYQDDLFLDLEQHGFTIIAFDGIALSAMRRTDRLLMAPGQRADILVRGGDPGTYRLQAMPYDQGYPSPTGLLAHLVVAGERMTMPFPTALPPGPLRTIDDAEITNRRELVFSARVPQTEAAAEFREFSFMIDGKLFDHDRVDQRIILGAVEEWTIKNLHIHDHVFHIHTNPFQVTRINGQPTEPTWRDTAVVPAMGSLTFRSRFLDYTGKFMLHCHMMNHEEMGMMQLVEVVRAP